MDDAKSAVIRNELTAMLSTLTGSKAEMHVYVQKREELARYMTPADLAIVVRAQIAARQRLEINRDESRLRFAPPKVRERVRRARGEAQ